MDELKKIATSFNNLLNQSYDIVLGYKGKSVNLKITFDAVYFKHLAGLHKLKDKEISTDDARVVFNRILDDKIKMSDISNSRYFVEIKDRLFDLINLEYYLDNSKEMFGWDTSQAVRAKINSSIRANYLISDKSIYIKNRNSYIFLSIDKIDKANKTIYISPTDIVDTVPSSFFNSVTDYTNMQKKYTLLYKEKIRPNESTVLFQHHNYTPQKKEQVTAKDISQKRNDDMSQQPKRRSFASFKAPTQQSNTQKAENLTKDTNNIQKNNKSR